MLAAVNPGMGHPAVAILFGLAAAGLAGAVVAMAWSVHVRQFRLAGQLARRQFLVTADTGTAEPDADLQVVLDETDQAGGGSAPAVVIEGPESVVVGEQARFRARCVRGCTVVAWAVGGGPVSQAPDPAHPDELLLVADRPGELTIFVRAREGMMERRATKSVAAEEDLTPTPPVSLRLFLHGWTLLAACVLVIGFAAALVALGSLASADFIALAVPLAALLAVAGVLRGTDDPPRLPAKAKAKGRLVALAPYQVPDLAAYGRNGHPPVDADRHPGPPG
jgi:hypothetical protein